MVKHVDMSLRTKQTNKQIMVKHVKESIHKEIKKNQ